MYDSSLWNHGSHGFCTHRNLGLDFQISGHGGTSFGSSKLFVGMQEMGKGSFERFHVDEFDDPKMV